ncbi:MAG: hypothetical protein V1862_12850 [Methanobacteriota archaeon]
MTDASGNLTRESGDIVIGAVLLMTGSEEETGKGAKDAIELALKHANDYYTDIEGLIHLISGVQPAILLLFSHRLRPCMKRE